MRSKSLRARFAAAGIHLCISLCLAALAAWLVFGLWYPYPYREISGGRELFMLVVAVDVVLGPLLTLAVFNPSSKTRAALRRDLMVIGVFQLAALSYGLWTVAAVRPVHLVYEFSRFRVVHAIELDDEALSAAPAGFRRLPLTGPTLLSLRPFKDNKEEMSSTERALAGNPLSAQPKLWQSYAAAKPQVLKEAKPLDDLKRRFPDRIAAIDNLVAKAGNGVAGHVGYIPMQGREIYWTVLVDNRSAEIVGFLPIDSF